MSVFISQSQISGYLIGKQSFIPDLLPSDAVTLSTEHTLYILHKRLGHKFYEAFDPHKTVESPLSISQKRNGTWLKSVNMIGINVRTIQSFWNIVKYNFTLSNAQSCIHLLPIWEPGVVASLYGMSSWNINPEFFSDELRWAMPHLDTVEKQLKVVINILHGLGKTVGMDVIPHTDRYSEQALANPQNFEWLQRIGYDIIRHDNDLHKTIQKLIYDFIKNDIQDFTDLPVNLPDNKTTSESEVDYFFNHIPESDRLNRLFGAPHDYEGRLKKREKLIQLLYDNHYEPVPATMGPPYRGIKVDKNGTPVIDEKGRVWLDYTITKPQKFSRVFGPLTRYKLYDNKNNNEKWAIDFERPIPSVWEYVAKHYDSVQEKYNFDFMRGDMAHVQMRPKGVPKQIDAYYDILKYIKNKIAQSVPYFASFAETFLAPPDEMAYGDEVEHLEASEADTTLGDLQSMVVGSNRFMQEFRRYLDIHYSRQVSPCFTIMTADKDDPRFDEFYLKGNEARFFISQFLTDMPSYMGLGFEQRDSHPTPAPNEHYTKLYVFRLDKGDKATNGQYIWGNNSKLFSTINAIKKHAEMLLQKTQHIDCQWIVMPDEEHKVIVWTHRCDKPEYLFVVNLDIESDAKITSFTPPQYMMDKTIELDFSTEKKYQDKLDVQQSKITIKNMKAGECRVYTIKN